MAVSSADESMAVLRAPPYSTRSASMKRWITVTAIAILLPALGHSQARIKDVAHLQGVRDNQLIGYGLVVGLNKTGDRRQTIFSTQSLINMLQRMGVTV